MKDTKTGKDKSGIFLTNIVQQVEFYHSQSKRIVNFPVSLLGILFGGA